VFSRHCMVWFSFLYNLALPGGDWVTQCWGHTFFIQHKYYEQQLDWGVPKISRGVINLSQCLSVKFCLDRLKFARVILGWSISDYHGICRSLSWGVCIQIANVHKKGAFCVTCIAADGGWDNCWHNRFVGVWHAAVIWRRWPSEAVFSWTSRLPSNKQAFSRLHQHLSVSVNSCWTLYDCSIYCNQTALSNSSFAEQNWFPD